MIHHIYTFSNSGQENTQAMVMVTTRALTKALQRALNNDEDFKKENITVGRLVGTNADIHIGGNCIFILLNKSMRGDNKHHCSIHVVVSVSSHSN